MRSALGDAFAIVAPYLLAAVTAGSFLFVARIARMSDVAAPARTAHGMARLVPKIADFGWCVELTEEDLTDRSRARVYVHV